MITLTKLAKLANVSVSTASKAFSGSREVNDETRDHIFRVAKEHECFKKFYNVKYPKLVIAVIAPEFRSMYYIRHLSVLQNCLDAENCEICVSTTDFSPEREKELIEYYYRHSNVDGIIIVGSVSEFIDQYEIPIVLVNSAQEDANCLKIDSNSLNFALMQVADYLNKKNVTSVGFIGEKLTNRKLATMKECLADRNIVLEESFVSISDGRFEEGGYQAMEKMFFENKLPRALICAYDHMAIGATRCIYDHGLCVPNDIAVLGMDDIPEAKFLNPPLASVSTPIENMCKLAAETVVKRIKGEEISCSSAGDCEFILRRSFEF